MEDQSSEELRSAGVPSQITPHGPSYDEVYVRAELRRWVRDHARARVSELNDRTPLLESGLISSLDVVELVLFLEELRGAEIETDDIEPELFANIDAMWGGFFAVRE